MGPRTFVPNLKRLGYCRTSLRQTSLRETQCPGTGSLSGRGIEIHACSFVLNDARWNFFNITRRLPRLKLDRCVKVNYEPKVAVRPLDDTGVTRCRDGGLRGVLSRASPSA